jgi:hypothetical protein
MQLLLLNHYKQVIKAASNIDVDAFLEKSGGSDVEIVMQN